MNWKKGPLPDNTWNWGGVVPVGETASGFYFADFRGDHVKLLDDRILKPDEIDFYNNSLDLPPCCPHGVRQG